MYWVFSQLSGISEDLHMILLLAYKIYAICLVEKSAISAALSLSTSLLSSLTFKFCGAEK